MSPDTLIAFSLFALVASITPGPNNIMLMTSGVNFGFRLTLPHLLGVTSGFLILMLAIGFGLAEIFTRLPWTFVILKWTGALYLLYLAWRIAMSGPVQDTVPDGRVAKPMGFWGAVAFQWVNPKAWVMAASAFSTYAPASSGMGTILIVSTLFALLGMPCIIVWTLFGSGLRHVLQVRRNLMIFNYTMAALLALSLYPLLDTS